MISRMSVPIPYIYRIYSQLESAVKNYEGVVEEDIFNDIINLDTTELKDKEKEELISIKRMAYKIIETPPDIGKLIFFKRRAGFVFLKLATVYRRENKGNNDMWSEYSDCKNINDQFGKIVDSGSLDLTRVFYKQYGKFFSLSFIDKSGYTHLSRAVKSSNVEIVRFLLENGARPNLGRINYDGVSFYEILGKCKNQEIQTLVKLFYGMNSMSLS